MAKLYKSNNKGRYFEFLIDTGVDYTLISKYTAKLLGIHYEEMEEKEIKVEAANLTTIHAKKTSLIVTIEKEKLYIPILISKEQVESLLGRKGIFEYFDVLFQENLKQVIFIKK